MPQKNNNSEGKSNGTGKRLPGQNSLLIRIMVGAYLLYTSYSLSDSFRHGGDTNIYIFGTFTIAFAVIGVMLIFFSGRDLYRGKYIGGRMDPETQDGAEDEKNEDQVQHEDQG